MSRRLARMSDPCYSAVTETSTGSDGSPARKNPRLSRSITDRGRRFCLPDIAVTRLAVSWSAQPEHSAGLRTGKVWKSVGKRLFIGNLSFDVTEADLRA